MQLPDHAQQWIDLVAIRIDLAVRRARSEQRSDASEAASQALMQRCEQEASWAQRFPLSAEQRLAAWVLIAAQVAPQVAGSLELLAGGPDVTLGALASIVYSASAARAVAELSSASPLFRFGLAEFADDPRAPTPTWMRRTLRASDRLLVLALGETASDPELTNTITAAPPIAVEDLATTDSAVRDVRDAMRTGRAIVVLSGMPGLGRRTLLGAVAKEAGIDVLEIDARKLAREPVALGKQLRAIARECKLLARTPMICNLDALVDDKDDRIAMVGSELVSLIDGLVLVTTGVHRPVIRWDRPVIAIEMAPPTSGQRAKLWHAALGDGTPDDADRLASQYPLAPGLIVRAAEAARARAGGKPLELEDVRAGVRAVLDDRLGQYARRVTVTQSWDDVVLPADQVNALVELVARTRERRRVYEEWGFGAKVGRGLGVSALLSGPPGTGKTMVAG